MSCKPDIQNSVTSRAKPQGEISCKFSSLGVMTNRIGEGNCRGAHKLIQTTLIVETKRKKRTIKFDFSLEIMN